MDRSNPGNKIIISRAPEDRRAAAVVCDAPYLTDEGFVLFDRREAGERRAQPPFASVTHLHQQLVPGAGHEFNEDPEPTISLL